MSLITSKRKEAFEKTVLLVKLIRRTCVLVEYLTLSVVISVIFAKI